MKLKPHKKVLLVDHSTGERTMYEGDAAQAAWKRYLRATFIDAKIKVICDMVRERRK